MERLIDTGSAGSLHVPLDRYGMLTDPRYACTLVNPQAKDNSGDEAGFRVVMPENKISSRTI